MIVEKEINRGGFGRVERVRLDDGGLCARKVYCPAFPIHSPADDLKLKKRFKREVRVQSSLNSAAFVPVTSFDLDCQEPWFLMPLAEMNLSEEIAQAHVTGNTPQKALADVLNALDELHHLGYVHRDLKPQNVLLIDGIWKLTDFGLVLPPSGTTTKLTSFDSNWGTAGYCAPEQAIEFRNVTPAADIYAFGCILHDIYANTSRVPYQRYSAPGPIGAIIEKCTEVKPEKRFKNIQSLRGALLTLLATSTNVTLSQKASEWVDDLLTAQNWTHEQFQSFVRFISHPMEYEERYAIFAATSEDTFQALYKLDAELWKSTALAYCEWANGSSYNFEYCDVVVRRLQHIFFLGDFECKASAALAAAELGRSHNRWFVMRQLFEMCGPSLDDQVAHRIAIEIKVQEAEQNFQRCAYVIDQNTSSYHPRIAEAVKVNAEI